MIDTAPSATASGVPGHRPPELPGVTTGRLLGVGAHGQVWSGIEAGSGRSVALKVLDLDPGRVDQARRESHLLHRIDHDHVVRLVRVEESACGRTVLVLERAAGGSLQALVGARGPLDPGEVVTVLTPLAQALAHLHSRGLVHADVSPGNVLFADSGRPLLSDLGLGRVLGLEQAQHGTPGYVDPLLALGGMPSPAGDVHGLGAVAWFALTGRAPQPAADRPPLTVLAPSTPAALAAVVETCLHPDAAMRPDAAALAVDVYDSAPAEPVRLVPTDVGADAADVVTHRLRRAVAEAEPEDPAPRSRRRWFAAGVACAALLVGTLGVSMMLGGGSAEAPRLARHHPAPAAPERSEPTAVSADLPPAEAVSALSELRAQAFSGGGVEPLRAASAPGSPALVADLATLEELRARDEWLRDLSFAVHDVVVLSDRPHESVVRATVVTGAHQVVGRTDGEVRSSVPASAPREVTLTLRREKETWQVVGVAGT